MWEAILHNLEENPRTFFLTCVVGLGIFAQWFAWRVRIPSIVLLLAFGFIAGQTSLLDVDQLLGRELLFALVSLSVAVILFEGGMTLRIDELDESGRTVLRLVTVGTLVTWVLASLAVWQFAGVGPEVAALCGAILTVTGPTVVGPLLRHIRPSRRIASVLKWEGIVIDPIGAVLAVLVYETIAAGGTFQAVGTVVEALLNTILIGGFIGLATAIVLVQLLKRFWIPDYLHSPVILAAVLASFTLSNLLQHESGLLTVTVLGIALANQRRVPLRHVAEFKENLQVLLISFLFIMLAARIHWSDLQRVAVGGAVVLAILIVVVRPASVMLSTIGAGLPMRERLYLGLIAPRGIVAAAVSSVFALRFSAESGLDVSASVAADASRLVPLTFLIIVGTVTFYGLAAAPIARRMGLSEADPQGVLFAGAQPWIRQIAEALHNEEVPVMLVDTNYRNVAAARMAGMKAECANVLSDFIQEEIERPGIGRFFAMTPNDEVNALAVAHLTHEFGRANVYRVSREPTGAARTEKSKSDVHGRILFADKATYRELVDRFAAGATVKATSITEEFTLDDFRQRHGGSVLPLFVVDEKGKLTVASVDAPLAPRPGQTLIALIDPSAAPAAESAESTSESTSESADAASA